jgi:hypothetical protein
MEELATQEFTHNCAYCNESKQKVWNGKKLKDGSKIYCNERGERWAGRRCPDCEKKRVSKAIKHDKFERSRIFIELEKMGYQIVSPSIPIKVSKDGQTFSVDVKRAYTENGKVILEEALTEQHDFVALVFETVRLVRQKDLRPSGEQESQTI